jgi:hypothetical protein
VVGAIAAVGTAVDLDRGQMEEYADLFLEASEEISARLGGELPEEVLASRQRKEKRR